MKNHLNILISAIVFAIAIFAFIYYVKSNDSSNSPYIEEAKLLENKELINTTLLELATNKDFTDEIRKGEVVLVYMLSSCEACKKETQTISQIQSKTNTKIFGVMFEDEDVVKNYIKEHNINFPILIDKDKKLFQTFGLHYFPTNLRLKNGVVQKALFGSPKDENNLLEFAK